MERVANSTPMVDLESRLNSLRVNRESKLDLPTPLSPIRTTRVKGKLVTERMGEGVAGERDGEGGGVGNHGAVCRIPLNRN